MDKPTPDVQTLTLQGRDYLLYMAGLHAGRADGMASSVQQLSAWIDQWVEACQSEAERNPQVKVNLDGLVQWAAQVKEILGQLTAAAGKARAEGTRHLGQAVAQRPATRRTLRDRLRGAMMGALKD